MAAFSAKQLLFRASDNDPSGLVRRAARRGYIKYRSLHNKRRQKKFNVSPLEGLTTKNNNTLFILGSGASIEDLRPEHFDEISEGVSVGINNWPIHDFIADAYSFEASRSTAKKRALSRCLNRDELLKKNPFLLLYSSYFDQGGSHGIDIPEALKTNARIYTSVPSFTRTKSLLYQAMAEHFREIKKGALPRNVALGQNASIERIASLGVTHGFGDIVFVGVDLNNTEYFFEKNPEYLKKRGIDAIPTGQSGDVHKTADPTQKRFPATIFINAMAAAAKTCFGTNMWAANRASALSEYLDTYPWKGGAI